MRFIDKKIIKAKAYDTWLKGRKDKQHPKYSSSSFEHYYSIVFDLLICQKSLCAYTEKFLTDINEVPEIIWENDNCLPFKFAGQLDHYSPDLKEKYAWSWENFFIVDTDVNTKNKRKIIPTGTLKPDKKDFDPNNFLEYNLEEHVFIPKTSLDDKTKKDVLHDLFALGVNFEPIIQLRKKYLNPFLSKIYYEQMTIEEAKAELFQFFTAFEMASSSLN